MTSFLTIDTQTLELLGFGISIGVYLVSGYVSKREICHRLKKIESILHIDNE